MPHESSARRWCAASSRRHNRSRWSARDPSWRVTLVVLAQNLEDAALVLQRRVLLGFRTNQLANVLAEGIRLFLIGRGLDRRLAFVTPFLDIVSPLARIETGKETGEFTLFRIL